MAEVIGQINEPTIDQINEKLRTTQRLLDGTNNLFVANSILKADTKKVPVALTVAQQRIVGRLTDGVIDDLTAEQTSGILTWALRIDGTRPGATDQVQDFGSYGISADNIVESTTDAGVTLETLLFKDGDITMAAGVTQTIGHAAGPLMAFNDTLDRISVTLCDTFAISSANNFDPTFQLTGTSDSNGPSLILTHNSATPATNDVTSRILFKGEDSNGSSRVMSRIQAVTSDVTYPTASGKLDFEVRIGGVEYKFLTLSGYDGSTVGSGEVVINEESRPITFRVESDVGSNAFVVDGATGLVGVNLSPTYYNAQLNVNRNATIGTIASPDVDNATISISDSNYEMSIDGNSIFTDGNLLIAAIGAGSITLGTNEVERVEITPAGNVGIGTAAPTYGGGRLVIEGPASDAVSGPHIQTSITGGYPVTQLLSYNNNSIHWQFDGYFDGTNWKSSTNTSNIRIGKSSDEFGIYYDTGNAAGATVGGWNDGLVLVPSTGNWGVGLTPTNAKLEVSSTGIIADFIRSSGGAAIVKITNDERTFGLCTNDDTFYIQDYGTTTTPFLINATGDVGIGTTTPARNVEISSSVATYLRITGGEGYSAFLELYADQGDDAVDKWDIVANANINALQFRNDGNHKVTLANDGSLGLGTTTPEVIQGFTATGINLPVFNIVGANPSIAIQGSGGARLNMVDTGGYANDKWMQLYVDSGRTEFRTVNDNGSAVQTNNILVIDHGSGDVGLGIPSNVGYKLHLYEPTDGVYLNLETAADQIAAISFNSNSVQKTIAGYYHTDNAFKISHAEAGTALNVEQFVIQDGRFGFGTLPAAAATAHFYEASTTNLFYGYSGNMLALPTIGSGMSGNLYYDGASWRYRQTQFGVLSWYDSVGGFGIFTAASGTAGNVATVGQKFYVSNAGKVGIGIADTTIPHGGVGMAKLAIDGTNASSAGPHIQITTDADNYPLMQILNYNHDNIHLCFDQYWSGSAWTSSDAGSSCRFQKNNDRFSLIRDSGTAQGSAITSVTAMNINLSNYLISFGTDVQNYTGIHLHNPGISGTDNSFIQYTTGDTGTGNAAGMLTGINSNSIAVIWNYENANLAFGTNNTERLTITGAGVTEIGTPGTNFSKFELDGTLEFNGTATVWDDYVTPLGPNNWNGASNNPTLTKLFDDGSSSQGVYSYVYADGDEAIITIQMPHKWKEGSIIYPHLHFMCTSDVDPTDEFGIEFEYTWADIDEDFPANSTLVTIDHETGVNTDNMHQLTNLTAAGIDGTGHTISSVLLCRIKRVAATSNNYADGIAFLDFDIHYEINTVGSRTISTK